MSKLSKAIRKAADKIEDSMSGFEWEVFEKCNLGILVGILLNKSPNETGDAFLATGRRLGLVDKHSEDSPSWTEVATKARKAYDKGELPKNDICRRLFDLGLTVREMLQLEFLSNKTVAKKAGTPLIDAPNFNTTKSPTLLDNYAIYQRRGDTFAVKENVVKYFRAYADYLDRRDAVPAVELPRRKAK